MSGDRLAVGAEGDDGWGTDGSDGDDTGAVYVFKRTGTIWSLEQEISDKSSGFAALNEYDYFGGSVSLSGDRLAVGAEGDDGWGTDGSDGGNTGAVYVFKRTGTTWSLEQEISDKSSGFTALESSDEFGRSASLTDNRLAVGAPYDTGISGSYTGAVYIFKRTGTTWSLEQEISDKSSGLITALESSDYFGWSTSLTDDRLAVGAHGDDGNSGGATGAVYVFRRIGTTWAQEREISDQVFGFTSLKSGDKFGRAVSLTDDRLAVGAPDDTGTSGSSTGAVYVFGRKQTTWSNQQEIYDQTDARSPTWDYFKTTNRDEPTCYSIDSSKFTRGQAAPITSADRGKWVCFRFEDDNYNYSYGKHQIDFQPPTVSVVQDDDSASGLTVDSDVLPGATWEVAGPNNSSGCDSKTTGFAAMDKLTSATDDKYYCFRVPDKNQNYGYGEIKIDLTTPIVRLVVNGATVTASGIQLSGFSYFKSTANPNCSKTNTTATYTAATSVSDMTNNQWICFRAKNSRGVYGYNKVQVNLYLILTQNDATVTATAASGATLTEFKYFKSTTEPACDSSHTYAAGTSTTLTNNQWVCFRAKKADNSYEYAKLQADLTVPSLSLTQNGATITASGIFLSGHSYFKSSTDPACTSDGTYSSTGTSATLTDKQWVCFRAKNDRGVYGYAKLQADLTPPVIALTQNNNKITATGKGVSGFAYFTKTSEPDCDKDDTDTYTNQATTAAMDDDDWVCFKAKNSKGVYGYAKLQIDLTAPIINLTQINRTITAFGDDLFDYRYFVATANPNCSSTNTSARYRYGKIATRLTDGRWVCFKARNSLNVWGWAELQLDTDKIYINIRQSQTKVIANSFNPGGSSNLTSISLSGDYLAVGDRDDYGSSGRRTGAVYIFRRTKSTWVLDQKIFDQAVGFKALASNDYFGTSVSLLGNRLAVGAPGDNGTSGSNTGAVYIFKRTGMNWSLEQEISDQATGFKVLEYRDHFGQSVSLTDDRLAVGAHEDDGYGGDDDSGAVYIFKRTGTTWGLEKELSKTANSLTMLDDDDEFGQSVSLTDDRLAVGAIGDDGYGGDDDSGAVYIFKRTGTTWALEQELSKTATSLTGLNDDHEFGQSVSLTDDRVAIGAPGDGLYSGDDRGAVYIFKRTGETWSQEQKISRLSTGLVLNSNDHFGYSVSLTDGRLGVGAPGDEYSRNGTVYIFKRTGTKWRLERRASGFTSLNYGDYFGWSVSLTEDGLATTAHGLGSYNDYYNSAYSSTGAFYVLERSGTFWSLEQEMTGSINGTDSSSWQNFKTATTTAPDCDGNDTFGTASASNNTVSVTSADNNKWVCFRVKDRTNNNYSYIKYKIDYNSPAVSPYQNGTDIIGASTSLDVLAGEDWYHSGPHDSSGCSSTTTGFVYGKKAANIVDDKYYCFKVADRAGNFGYGELQADLTVPTITLTRTEATVKASGTSLSDYQYFKSDDDPICNSTNTVATWTKGVSATKIKAGKWVCFKAKNSKGVWGYIELQVFLDIVLTQNNTTITATSVSGLTLSSYSYFKSTTDPTCDSSKTTGWTTGSSATSLVDNQWVCFRAQKADNSWVYLKIQTDLTSPTITLAQDKKTVTGTGLDLSGWEYFKSTTTEPTCDGSDGKTYTSGSSVSNLGDDDWVCFKAKNKKGVWGYAKLQVDLTVPTVTVTQDNDIVTGSGTGLTGFEYFVNSTTEPTCDATNTTSYTVGSRTSTLADDDWVCFKAKNSRNIYGYAKIEVDLTPPTLTLTQSNDTLVATGTNLTGFSYSILTSSQDSCDSSTTVFTDGSTTSRQTDSNWICFKAKNSRGVYGYAKMQIDLTEPILIIGQNNQTVKAVGTGLSGFSYFLSSTLPSCSKDNTTATWTTKTSGSVGSLTNGQWVCFRAKNSKGVYGYASIQVVLTPTSFFVQQNNSTLTVGNPFQGFDLNGNDRFGYAVSISGSRMAVGARWHRGHSGPYTGAVYIFKKTGSTWTLEQAISDQASGFMKPKAYDSFGFSVSLDGDRLAVGAYGDRGYSGWRTGAVYVFKRTRANWALEQEIVDKSSGFNNLLSGDYFGWSVSLDSDRLAVGAYRDRGHSGWRTGAVYIFVRTGTTWALEQEISDQSSGFNNLLPGDYFGDSVSLDGDRLAVGAPYDDGISGGNTGAAYVFKRTGTTWALEQEISDKSSGFDNLLASDYFGYSVSLDGDRLAVGAYGDRGYSGSRTGAAYVFKRTGTTWALEQEIVDKSSGFDNLLAYDYFGYSVSLDGDRLAVGAHRDNGSSGSDTGAAYVFKRTGTTWALEQEISDKSSGFTNLLSDDEFGISVSLDGDHLAVGAWGDDNALGNDTGTAYVFSRSNTSWSLGEEMTQEPDIILSTLKSFRSTSQPNCNSGDSSKFTTSNLSRNTYTMSGADHNKWLCFRVKNNRGVYSYIKLKINLELSTTFSPIISIVQDRDSADATATMDANLTITDASWQNFKTTDSTEPNCNSSDASKFNNASSSSYTITTTSADDNKWVCFRVKNSANVYGYGKYQLDYEAPVVVVRQNGTTLTATTTATDLPAVSVWQVSGPNDASGCDSTTTQFGIGSTVTNASDDKYYCFKITDEHGNTGYKEIQAETTPPDYQLDPKRNNCDRFWN